MTDEHKETVRAFIACSLDEATKERIRELSARLQKIDSGVKWVRPEAMHLTLRFLGNVDGDDIELAGEAIEEAGAGVAPVQVVVGGHGTFPPGKKPRVIWLGLKQGGDELYSIYERLEKSLQAKGLGPADKAFRPHLTLGRVKSPKGVNRVLKDLEEVGDRVLGEFTAREITLFKSELHPSGAVYTDLKKAKLTGG
jgi:2'-5' RNA ligase